MFLHSLLLLPAADLTGDKVQLIESPGEKRKRRREARAKRSEASQVIA